MALQTGHSQEASAVPAPPYDLHKATVCVALDAKKAAKYSRLFNSTVVKGLVDTIRFAAVKQLAYMAQPTSTCDDGPYRPRCVAGFAAVEPIVTILRGAS